MVFPKLLGNWQNQYPREILRILNKVKQNIFFFDWFHAYSIKNEIDYPWKTDLREKTLDVLWHLKDNETVQSDLPPDTKF